MQSIYRQIERVTKYDIPVLILGETGTGKDLLARELHRAADKPEELYFPVNMGAIPKELVASTLFGYERGAFTGATSLNKGLFETANGGTLFLDEIATMDEKLQVSLLRVIEEKKFRRVGGTSLHACNVRLVAASNVDLQEAVEAGSFREDLYYRLNVFSIRLPPLRKRGGDILLLANTFCQRYGGEFAKDVRGFTDEAEKWLTSYHWPGNIRELENAVIRGVIVADTDLISEEDLRDGETRCGDTRTEKLDSGAGVTLEEAERELIEATLQKVDGHKGEAARMLGISRKGFYNKLKKYQF